MKGFKEVKKNRGSPGIDGIRIEDFNAALEEELDQLRKELLSWTYKPQPVRRVEIPKPGGGIRLLGVPCIRDRVVQASIKVLLEPTLEAQFSDHSYGFRPNRNQAMAVKNASKIVQSGKPFVVDIDLSKFFDRINHDRLISQLRNHIDDKRVLRIIGLMLRSGIMDNGTLIPSTEGTTQGSPLSPLLSNLVLDQLDKELESRGLEFCRYADDCNIFASSQKAAERIMNNICTFIERRMKLVVNREKSQVAPSHRVKFLGMTIVSGTIAISHKALQNAMSKVKELTPRGTHETLDKTIVRINKWYRGWSSYFGMTQYPAQLRKIEAHIRRRLRARLVSQKKKRSHLYRFLIKEGIQSSKAHRTAYSKKKRWAMSHSPTIERVYSNKWFESVGLHIKSRENLPHWFSLNKWVKLI